jgi:hypothetical protein
MSRTLQRKSKRATSRIGAGLLLAATLAMAAPTAAQRIFATPQAAVDALVDGLARNDEDEVHRVLGPGYRRLMPFDASSEEDVTDFLAGWAKGHRVEAAGDRARLMLSDGWSLPIPLVRSGGGWTFDLRSGVEEMRTRRIGRHELAAIQSVYAYFDAQREYAEQDHRGDGILEYARRFLSSPGKRYGLYWATTEGEPPSPAGPRFDTRNSKDGITVTGSRSSRRRVPRHAEASEATSCAAVSPTGSHSSRGPRDTVIPGSCHS